MKINLASQNPVKIEALTEMISDYPRFQKAEVVTRAVQTGVSEQPKSLQETVEGAVKRAQNAFQDCDFSVGIESGMMAVPYTQTGFLEMTVCAFYDGEAYYIGMSSAWETTKLISDYVHKEGLDLNQAAYKAGLTTNPNLGKAEGLVGLLTKGRLTRKEYTKQAILTAMIHLDIIP